MKIGILTYHRAHNYGALLQAYALKNYLNKQGYNDVEFVDYFPDYHWKIYANIQRKSLRNLSFKELLLYPYYYCFEFIPLYILKEKRRKSFLRFIDNYIIPKSKDYQNMEYDIVIYGSDQIWRKQNKKTCPEFNKMYFGDESIKAKRRITYSASMGTTDLNSEDKKFLAESLKKFASISVRESDLYETIKSITSQHVKHTLDPVFLLSKHEWLKLNPKRVIKEKYILFYNFQDDNESKEISKHVSTLLDLPIIELVGTVYKPFYKKHTKTTACPLDFLSLINNAEFVVTSSFHGVALSIIFEKQFYTYAPHKQSRITSLLRLFGLENRFIKDVSDINIINQINYNEVNPLIEIEINKSKKCLAEALK